MYRPPEIVDPYLQYTVGVKVDLWMLGCLLYTLAYFTHPFIDANAIGIANAVFKFPKDTQYKVSSKIQDLIRNLLTPNPNHRPSVAQVMQLLANWQNY
jgi:AP2-associated kinase